MSFRNIVETLLGLLTRLSPTGGGGGGGCVTSARRVFALIAGNPKRDLYEQNYGLFSLEDRKRDPNPEFTP